MTSGFTAPPDPPKGIICDSEAEAWRHYRAEFSETHGYPVPIGGGRWLLPQPTRLVTERKGMSMAEYQALGLNPQVSAPPTPGSAANAAKLKDEDRKRISDREAAKVEKRRLQAEKEAEEERRRQAQGSLFG